jgi:hypothetical protein
MYKNKVSVFGFGVKKEGKCMRTIIFITVPVGQLQMIAHENIMTLLCGKRGSKIVRILMTSNC